VQHPNDAPPRQLERPGIECRHQIADADRLNRPPIYDRARRETFIDDDDPKRVPRQQLLEPLILPRRERLNRRDDHIRVPARAPLALLDIDHHARILLPDLVGRLIEQLLPMRDHQHRRAPLRQSIDPSS
jgi:hypothetical protein